ncbi:YciI family protein [Abyssibacter sp.]|jgi:hypothetical protein|uniref:YciI family protein n=1 Tax=Abyssibacter sp. TaxID=2320200 RepID=UPI0025BE0544|nr:YciI family protein [Abyssibacter sp.]MCK5858526.1 hypothetical protein [Abyssibacter sp.]
MRYMLMCCMNEAHWNGLDEATRDDVMTRYRSWVDQIDAAGQHVLTHQLMQTATATTLRSPAGREVITDGPFAETREQFGGFHLIDCEDLDAALAIARRIPTLAVGGTIEVRPLVDSA